MKTCRRKWFVQWVAAFVSIVLFGTYLGSLSMNTLTVSAICCRKDGFDKSRYTLTGNVAQDVATIAKSQAGRTCSDFGYSGVDYGAWCDEYVADCLENAGCDDSIVAHGGTVADFEKKMRKRGAVVVSSPQPGDLLFFSWSHVEIVTRVEGGTVYCAGGNNQGKTYPGGRCAGERNAQSVAKSMGGSIRLYLRPNYPNPDPPTVSNISIDKALYAVGENVVFHVSSDKATGYLIGIYRNGERVDTTESFSESIYNYTPTTAGDYSAYVTSYNSSGYVDSALVYFSVYDSKPIASFLKTDKSSYSVGETIKFTIESDNAVNYAIGIYKDNERIDSIASDTNEVSYTITKAGNYSAYVTSSNVFGYLDSNRNDCHFCVYNSEQEMTHNGDLNSDNTLTAADAVLLQRYLLGEDTLTQSQWQTADLNADGTVNGFDLALLRQKLVA